MNAIRKETSGELLTKQAARKRAFYIKNTFILKLLLNVVTAGTEALVIPENRFCTCVREVCCL
jgi:hypothetical protein